jgi:glycosyltransferase involved in cell wall biosynthesis
MNHKRKVSVLFFANANTSRIVSQDLSAKDIIAHFDDRFEVFIFNSGNGDIDPKCLKPNVHIIDRQTIFQKILAIYYSTVKPMDYHFYVRSYQSPFYWWFKNVFRNRAKTIHQVEILLPYPAGRAYQKRAQRNALKSDFLFGITDLINESVAREYGRTVTGKIPIGVDTTVFKRIPVDKRQDRLRILSVGSLQPRKRPDFFVQTARHFPEADFVWIGDGEEKKKVLQIASSNQVSNFQLLSPMSHSDLAIEMNRSDLFFFPSKHEGLPKVVAEAMACGLPAIVFDDYKPEHVQNSVSGYIVSSDQDAHEKLRCLIESKALREQFSIQAIKRAQVFSWKDISAKWMTFLLENRECS